jgi:GNAT superfamily N-acetyltransferase
LTVRDIKIRKLDANHVPQARDLILNGFLELSGPEIIETWYGDVRALGEQYVGNERQAGFVALDDSRVIGAALIRARCPTIPPLAGRYNPEATCELGRVIVEPEYRGRGVARMLVEYARRWARERYAVLTLHTHLHNPTALRFWSRLAIKVHETADGTVYFELPLDAPIPVGPPSAPTIGPEGTP